MMDCIQYISAELIKSGITGKVIVDAGAMDGARRFRTAFAPHKPACYIGIDIWPGMGVDVCIGVERLMSVIKPEIADIVVSAATLEHVQDWRAGISSMKTVCKPDGIVFIAIPSRYMYHACPGDYWRFSEEDLKDIFSDFQILETKTQVFTDVHWVSYVKARKPVNFVEKDLSGIEPRIVRKGDKI